MNTTMELDRRGQAHFNRELDVTLVKLSRLNSVDSTNGTVIEGLRHIENDLKEKAMSVYMSSKIKDFASALCNIMNSPDPAPYYKTETAKNAVVATINMGLPKVSEYMFYAVKRLRKDGTLFGKRNAADVLEAVHKRVDKVLHFPDKDLSNLRRSA
ncbi:MAG: hypothetical protein KGI06_03345 [Candidatus Micrarchaeota archaeon]|nr:hypothetical protein [Candidatus Micrarchaeota archaeon]